MNLLRKVFRMTRYFHVSFQFIANNGQQSFGSVHVEEENYKHFNEKEAVDDIKTTFKDIKHVTIISWQEFDSKKEFDEFSTSNKTL